MNLHGFRGSNSFLPLRHSKVTTYVILCLCSGCNWLVTWPATSDIHHRLVWLKCLVSFGGIGSISSICFLNFNCFNGLFSWWSCRDPQTFMHCGRKRSFLTVFSPSLGSTFEIKNESCYQIHIGSPSGNLAACDGKSPVFIGESNRTHRAIEKP